MGMKTIGRALSLIAVSVVLSACIKESGDPDEGGSKTFSVELKSVDVRRVSSGEKIEVETDGIESTNLTYR